MLKKKMIWTRITKMRQNKNLPKPIMWLSEVHRLQARMVSQKQSRGLYKRLVKSENKSSSHKKNR